MQDLDNSWQSKKKVQQLMQNWPWWSSGLRPYLKFKKRECLRSQVGIPSRDYDINRSELEITCNYSNNRVPGAFSIKLERHFLEK